MKGSIRKEQGTTLSRVHWPLVDTGSSFTGIQIAIYILHGADLDALLRATAAAACPLYPPATLKSFCWLKVSHEAGNFDRPLMSFPITAKTVPILPIGLQNGHCNNNRRASKGCPLRNNTPTPQTRERKEKRQCNNDNNWHSIGWEGEWEVVRIDSNL